MGATCFMSVVLQSLIHNPLIRNFYLTDGHRARECLQTNCMSCAVEEVFAEFFTSDKVDGYGPVTLLTTSWKCEQVLSPAPPPLSPVIFGDGAYDKTHL